MGVNRNILNLAVPSILANITVPIVGMADIAVAGHLDSADLVSSATLIGGVAIGTMLFDLLYWNFGFLRVGTGGLTAQAYGRGDMTESARILGRAASIALLCSAILIAVQWLFVKAAFLVVDCSPEVRSLASEYFFVRIWASPATLTLMAFKGWFIGMQDSISPMITDLTVNIVNCTVDAWDTLAPWQGFLICQDYTSGSSEEVDTNNLFGNNKITVNFTNLVHNGEKIIPDNLQKVCGTGNDDQIVYIYAEQKDPSNAIPYSENIYPIINFN